MTLLAWKEAIWHSIKVTFAVLGFFWISGELARQVFGEVPTWALVNAQLAAIVVAHRFFTGRWHWWPLLAWARQPRKGN